MLGRWDKRIVDQASDVPSIIFFFMISCKVLCKNPFNFLFLFLFLYNFTEIKIKSFECPISKPATHCFIFNLPNNTWTIRRLAYFIEGSRIFIKWLWAFTALLWLIFYSSCKLIALFSSNLNSLQEFDIQVWIDLIGFFMCFLPIFFSLIALALKNISYCTLPFDQYVL